jgi:hypothetical protein
MPYIQPVQNALCCEVEVFLRFPLGSVEHPVNIVCQDQYHAYSVPQSLLTSNLNTPEVLPVSNFLI